MVGGHGRWHRRTGAAWLALLVLALLGPLAGRSVAAEPAARRLALVIGNNAYETSPLANSINDARAMGEALQRAGFTVMLHTDADQRQMQQALREFGERLKLGGGTGLFYFAGHGMQIKGRNYLVPVRANIEHEDEVAYSSLDAQAVLDKMESAGNGTNIVILDACRNNPFARTFRSAQQGLAQMDAPAGSMVVFATAPGSVAIDNLPGYRNGLFTAHLLEAMRRPGLKLEDVLKQSRLAVLRASGNRQMPWESSALVGDFYFHPPAAGEQPVVTAAPAPSAAPAVDTQAAIDDALWEVVKDSRSSAEIYAYLNRFPNGRHAREARQRLLALADPAARPSASTQTAPATPSLDPEPRLAPTPASLQAAAQAIAPAAIGAAAAARRVEEQARWGEEGADYRRPPGARRSAAGFAEGDRYRYVKTDFFGSSGGVSTYTWVIDRVEPDGALWVNGGRQRLDPLGQRRSGNDEHTGEWLDFAPPLPLADAVAKGAGAVIAVSTTVKRRDADGLVEEAAMTGFIRTSSSAVRGPRGTTDLLPSVVVEVQLKGSSKRSDGVQRDLVWTHTYWFAPGYRLPVALSVYEVADGLTRQNTRHEMVAVDQLVSAAP